jgi:cyclopropane fatty-acyl-phospholipid synthase-like methyltransferase
MSRKSSIEHLLATDTVGTMQAVQLLAARIGAAFAAVKGALYSGFGRDRWQKPDEVIRALALKPGDRVADLGSGGGYFTFRLAREVTPSGIVYAVDRDLGLLRAIARRAAKEKVANVRTVEAAADDPALPEPVQLVFVSNAYHHLDHRAEYFRKAARYVALNGRIAILEGKREGFFARLFGHATSPATIRAEMRSAGYRVVDAHDLLPRESFLIFALEVPSAEDASR